MSNRVVQTLAELAPAVEKYSIDECFPPCPERRETGVPTATIDRKGAGPFRALDVPAPVPVELPGGLPCGGDPLPVRPGLPSTAWRADLSGVPGVCRLGPPPEPAPAGPSIGIAAMAAGIIARIRAVASRLRLFPFEDGFVIARDGPAQPPLRIVNLNPFHLLYGAPDYYDSGG